MQMGLSSAMVLDPTIGAQVSILGSLNALDDTEFVVRDKHNNKEIASINSTTLTLKPALIYLPHVASFRTDETTRERTLRLDSEDSLNTAAEVFHTGIERGTGIEATVDEFAGLDVES
jgi:hypothetical protein